MPETLDKIDTALRGLATAAGIPWKVEGAQHLVAERVVSGYLVERVVPGVGPIPGARMLFTIPPGGNPATRFRHALDFAASTHEVRTELASKVLSQGPEGEALAAIEEAVRLLGTSANPGPREAAARAASALSALKDALARASQESAILEQAREEMRPYGELESEHDGETLANVNRILFPEGR